MKEFLNMYQNLNTDNRHLLGTVYTENVQFFDPACETNGIENLTAYFGALYGNVKSIRFSFHHAHEDKCKGYVHWDMTFSPHLAAVGSLAAYIPLLRAEAHGSCKAAVAYMIETLQMPLSKEEIAVSLICPRFVKTRLTDLNDFSMPLRITPQEASSYIRKGLARKKAEIHFPKRFTYIFWLLSYFPRPIWNKLAQHQMVKK